MTWNLQEWYSNFIDFNSHAHVERDFALAFFSLNRKISTHTLTWSVTCSVASEYSFMNHFNSHAHVERDVHTVLLL